MRNTSGHVYWIVAALAALLLAGCPRPATPAPTPLPPTAQPATATPAAATPDGWVEQGTDALSIRLPADWDVIDFSAGDAQAIFDNLAQNDPELAGIVGSADALQGAAFWAFRSAEAGALFVDNLNIRRTPLNGQRIAAMQEVVDPVVAQYEQLGFQVLAVDANLTIGGLPAGQISSSFEINMTGDGPNRVLGQQYLVATETDLWILSYSASPDSAAALAPVFEQSARSFRVK